MQYYQVFVYVGHGGAAYHVYAADEKAARKMARDRFQRTNRVRPGRKIEVYAGSRVKGGQPEIRTIRKWG